MTRTTVAAAELFVGPVNFVTEEFAPQRVLEVFVMARRADNVSIFPTIRVIAGRAITRVLAD